MLEGRQQGIVEQGGHLSNWDPILSLRVYPPLPTTWSYRGEVKKVAVFSHVFFGYQNKGGIVMKEIQTTPGPVEINFE